MAGKMYVIDENNKSLVDLVMKAKAGNEKDVSDVLERMLSLVKKCAKENNSWKFGNGIDEDDLFQAGCQGVLRAIDKYDPKFKKTFSTYAKFWIQDHMRYMIYHHSATIRIPLLKARKYNQMRKDMETMGIDEVLDKHCITEDKFEELTLDNPRTVSIHDECGDDEGGPRKKNEDYIGSNESFCPYFQVDSEERMGVFKECLSKLSKKEREVIEGFYGLVSGPRDTLVDLGRKYGCTSQNLYMIKSKAVKKLRDSVREKLGIESPELEESGVF